MKFPANYKIGELSKLTGVKTGTIRFYEECGFLEPVARLSNGYRIYNLHHLYQIKICHLAFQDYANKYLRKKSYNVIFSISSWNLPAFEQAIKEFSEAVASDIERTKEAISIATNQIKYSEKPKIYSKRQASEIIGVTMESIRNWERNELLLKTEPYQKRYYSKPDLDRMYVIRLLLDTGYSMMAIKHFFQFYDQGALSNAQKTLICPDECSDLWNRADRYLETLERIYSNSTTFSKLLSDMKEI